MLVSREDSSKAVIIFGLVTTSVHNKAAKTMRAPFHEAGCMLTLLFEVALS